MPDSSQTTKRENLEGIADLYNLYSSLFRARLNEFDGKEIVFGSL